jgi:aldehyde:ferredoxin oxidoreductase
MKHGLTPKGTMPVIPANVRRLLYVNLPDRRWHVEELDERLYQRYLGGSGIAARILYDELDANAGATDPESTIVFMNGLLTGSFVPTACKMTVCARSPLTGIWCESTVGGYFPAELNRAGFGGVVIRGRADEPVYLWIKDHGEVGIADCDEIWSLDTFKSSEILKERTDPKAQVAAIGPAGAKLVKISNIMFGGEDARAAGRGGLGAAMGSKNLKAIVVRGTQGRWDVYDRENLIREVRTATSQIKEFTRGLSDFGTAGAVESVELHGDLPIKNWRLGAWKEGAAKTSGRAMVNRMFVRHYGCYACPISCGKILKINGDTVRGPEYEATAGFGALCLNEDVESIVRANRLCNMYGLDTISTSAVIAFAMEAYEKGIITDSDGIPLSWGNADAIIQVIHRIANREGIGELLGSGVRRAAEVLGNGAEEFAIHTKGLEYPYHDPRAFIDMAANYATANRGGCHLESFSYPLGYGTTVKELGYDKEIDPHSNDGKAEIAVTMQNLMSVYNGLGLCKFLLRADIGPELLNIWTNCATGWHNSMQELMSIGERIFNLKRAYNVKLGISRRDDVLPKRFLTAHEEGAAAGSSPDMERLLTEYYRIRGWTEDGVPIIELPIAE